MTTPTGDTETTAADPHDGPRFVPVVTVRDRTGDRGQTDRQGGGEAAGDPPRAGDAHAHTREAPSITRRPSITLRGVVAASHQLAAGALQVVLDGADDVAEQWSYLRGRTWMRGRDNAIQLVAGWGWALLACIPLTVLARLAQAIVVLAADTAVTIATRYTRAAACAAIVAAVIATWPGGTP